jgi:hypothetical protein
MSASGSDSSRSQAEMDETDVNKRYVHLLKAYINLKQQRSFLCLMDGKIKEFYDNEVPGSAMKAGLYTTRSLLEQATEDLGVSLENIRDVSPSSMFHTLLIPNALLAIQHIVDTKPVGSDILIEIVRHVSKLLKKEMRAIIGDPDCEFLTCSNALCFDR